MEQVQLHGLWIIEGPLGSGGFGQVFRGHGPDGQPVAVKLLPKGPSADRELLMAELGPRPNVVPIFDHGEYGDSLALVMPLATESLRNRIDRSSPMSIQDALPILKDVAEALAGLPDIVHRDLKPENILLLDGRWQLADFGISRYAEATTASATLQGAMTLEYAAPEQWRMERVTPATDVYAFGVIAYELLSGSRPFLGPAEHDFRNQHLHETPKELPVTAKVAALIQECLLKAAPARPPAANIRQRLGALNEAGSAAAERLQAAHRDEVSRQARAAAAKEVEMSDSEKRAELFAAAKLTFTRSLAGLAALISQASPSAGATFPFRLNDVELAVKPIVPIGADALAYPGYARPFDVVAASAIFLRFPKTRHGYAGRVHGLWFCDAQAEGDYRWFEHAFMFHPMVSRRFELDPNSLSPAEDAAGALSPVMDEYQLAWPFMPFDRGEDAEFTERWASWFADAVSGQRDHPQRMPERETRGSYRMPRPKAREGTPWPQR